MTQDAPSLRRHLATVVGRSFEGEGEWWTPYPGLMVARRSSPTAPTPYLYEPAFAMIIEGRKRVVLGDVTYVYDASRFLLTSLDLPTITQVLDASPEAPYLSLLLKLDLSLAREVMVEIDQQGHGTSSRGAGLALGPVTVELLDAMARLIALLDKPRDLAHLGRLIHREVLYWLLTGPAGGQLRQTVLLGTQSHRVARAVTWLRENFTQPVKVEELAAVAGMGVSTLHRHFRALTAMSPLQYQKHLRLHEARRLLLAEGIDVGTAALRVGYESATQFNREYRRQFGAPPLRDIKALRAPSRAGELAT
ncbi:AraC family transcriptional regulator [Chromohalobacter israelensis]|uniref:AraC family transcriptional regulator n=1 Tax=Chromohalobacter israelensis TaxID=141390 RepID=UPI00265BC311|nr:AraC family transcriptional regulator [Chromohalobacter salexigens]MDO0944198.1 AraC family transcriptional regulator [Chromohalobacter salexigens]